MSEVRELSFCRWEEKQFIALQLKCSQKPDAQIDETRRVKTQHATGAARELRHQLDAQH